MASHGIPRSTTTQEKSEETRLKELEEIKQYQSLVETVNQEVAAQTFTPALLRQTADLLKRNPEYYTVWNHRRRIYTSEFDSLNSAVKDGSLNRSDRDSQILDIIKLDLQFLFPLLLKFPKCYWIWNHRLWLLQSSTDLLSAPVARKIWEEELVLDGKMLTRDPRNYHGWAYRRTVIAALESPELDLNRNSGDDVQKTVRGGTSMAKQELTYTKKMIETNLSNFSAWHNRTQLLLRYLDEKKATDEERQEVLEEELNLIHSALFDPYDASLWSYHQVLLSHLDPTTSLPSITPNLSFSQRQTYLNAEKEFILEMLDDDDPDGFDEERWAGRWIRGGGGGEGGEGGAADDCKCIYQRLIDVVVISAKIRQLSSSEQDQKKIPMEEVKLEIEEKRDVWRWLMKLGKLDPLRGGRWRDLERGLGLHRGGECKSS